MGEKKKVSNVISISGDETVEDLIAKVEMGLGGKNPVTSVLALIRMTTARTNPATYNQFIKKLKRVKPNIYEENKKVLDLNTDQNEDFFSKISNLFKSSKQKTIDSLNKNNLGIMSSLIIQAEMASRIRGEAVYVFSQQKKVEECEM